MDQATELLQTNLIFKEVSSMNYGGSVEIEAPPGYQFLQMIPQTHEQYSKLLAVFVEVKTFSDAVAAVEQKKREEITKYEERKDKEYADKITKKMATMKLNQAFSDAITKFNIGDKVFYYSEWPVDNNIEAHIKSFTLSQIVYQQHAVTLRDENDSNTLQLKGYDGDAKSHLAFTTKEEAIARSADEHKEYLDKRATEDKKLAEAKAEREAAILKQAEEIRQRASV